MGTLDSLMDRGSVHDGCVSEGALRAVLEEMRTIHQGVADLDRTLTAVTEQVVVVTAELDALKSLLS